MDTPLPLRRLRRILSAFGVEEDESRGKGSHTLFYKEFDDGRVSYPVPTNKNPVLLCNIRGCPRKFRLTPDHGVSDRDFYDAG